MDPRLLAYAEQNLRKRPGEVPLMLGNDKPDDSSDDEEDDDAAPGASPDASKPASVPTEPRRPADDGKGMPNVDYNKVGAGLGMNSDLLGYLNQLQQQRQNMVSPGYQASLLNAQRPYTSPGMIAALAKNASLAGSIGGKTADASSVGDYAKDLEAGEAQRQKSIMGNEAMMQAQNANTTKDLEGFAGKQFEAGQTKAKAQAAQDLQAQKLEAGGEEGEADRASKEKVAKITASGHQAALQNANSRFDLKSAQLDQTALGKDLDSMTASNRQTLGTAAGKVFTADRILSFTGASPGDVVASQKDPAAKAQIISRLNHLTPGQYEETVNGLLNMVAPGNGSLAQLEGLKAPTAEEQMTRIKQYFTADHQDANLGKLIYDNLQTILNERNTSSDVIKRHNDLMRYKHPTAFSHPAMTQSSSDMLDAFNRDLAESGSMPSYKPSPSSPSKSTTPSQYQEGQTGTQKSTGKKIIYRNGAWVPMNE